MNQAPGENTPTPESLPVEQTQRIRSIDVLRGFALFGVLLMNMQTFAEVFAVYMNPYAAGELSTADYVVWSFNHVFADAKFITIFSMLFGAGVVLMTQRATERTGRSAAVHYRRMAWMMLFGIGHSILIWNGDILFLYGLLGLVAYTMRHWRPKWQLIAACILLLIPAFLLSTFDQVPADDLEEMRQIWEPDEAFLTKTRAAMTGDYWGQLPVRLKGWLDMLGLIVLFGWRVLACMLIGMAFYSWDVFSAKRSARTYVSMMLIGFGMGLPLAAWGIYDHEQCNWEMVRSMGVGSLFNYFGSLAAAIGWIGLVMLVCRTNAWPHLRSRFAAVGQMALTNYILQSIICTTIFNGHGLGWFGSVDRVWQQILVVAIFSFQLWYSAWWLSRFRYGPLEWGWRSLTYWKLQPFRRRPQDEREG